MTLSILHRTSLIVVVMICVCFVLLRSVAEIAGRWVVGGGWWVVGGGGGKGRWHSPTGRLPVL